MNIKDIFLISSAVFGVMSVIPYCLDIRRGKTRPNLVSWITWTLLTGVATAAEIAAGEYRAAIFTGSATLATTLVVMLGLRHGYVKYSRFDVICQIGAVAGIIIWQIFDSPLLGVFASIAIDSIGALPTLRHSWIKPFEETWQTYAISVFTASLGIAGIENYNWTNLAYAVYIALACALLTSVILYRRQRVPA